MGAESDVMGMMPTWLHAKKLEPKQLHVVMIMLMVTRVGMMGLMQPVPVSNSKWSMPVVANARHRTYTVRVDNSNNNNSINHNHNNNNNNNSSNSM